MTAPCCEAGGCSRVAILRYRILPRRDCDPLTDAMRRAVTWPGAADPVAIAVCGAQRCFDLLRAAAVTVMGAEAIGDDVTTRKVAE